MINWILYTDAMVGDGHPSLADTLNRALKQVLSESSYAADGSDFAGFAKASHGHSAADITSGTLGVARGGTGVATVPTGNLLLGALTAALVALAPGAAGGYVRSDGTTWARVSGVAASDLTGNLAYAALPSGSGAWDAGVGNTTTFTRNVAVSGSLTATLTGNASTATALQNARTLWGVSFDGTANVTAAPTFGAGATFTTLTASGATSSFSVNAAAAYACALELSNNGAAGTSLTGLAFSNGVGTVKASVRAAVFGDDYLAFHTGSDTERFRLTTTTGVFASIALSGITTLATTNNITVTKAANAQALVLVSANAGAHAAAFGVYDSATNSGAGLVGTTSAKNFVIITSDTVRATFAAASGDVTFTGALSGITSLTATDSVRFTTSASLAQGYIAFNSTFGLAAHGKTGGTYDFTIFEADGGVALGLTTGTPNWVFSGALSGITTLNAAAGNFSGTVAASQLTMSLTSVSGSYVTIDNAGPHDTGFRLVRSGGTAAAWFIYSPSGQSRLDFFSSGANAMDLTTAGGLTAYAFINSPEYRVSGTKVVGAQGAAVADATGAGDVVAQLNAWLARARAHGLIAT